MLTAVGIKAPPTLTATTRYGFSVLNLGNAVSYAKPVDGFIADHGYGCFQFK